MEQALVKGNGAVIQREEFGVSQLQVVKETAATAVAAREKAAVEARYIMAMNRPRNIEYARQQLLKACDNKTFALSSWYKIPNRGEGFTIRFAEEALRCFGNVFPETMTVYENEQLRMLRITVTDLESNLSYSSEIIIQKTIERKNSQGRAVIGERLNSSGEKVFIVEATDAEVFLKQNILRSKAIRTDGLRLIPSWLKDEAKQHIFEAAQKEIKGDLDGARRKLIDSFAEIGVKVPDLEAYLFHTTERMDPKEVSDLRSIWVAVTNGETSWAEIIESRKPSDAEKTGSKKAATNVAEEKLAEIHKETAAAKTAAAIDLEDFPDISEMKDGQEVKVKGKFYAFDAERSAFVLAEVASIPEEKEEPAQTGANRGFAFGSKKGTGK